MELEMEVYDEGHQYIPAMVNGHGGGGGRRNAATQGSSTKNGNGTGGGDDDDPYSKVTLESVGGLDTQIAWLKQSILSSLSNDSMHREWGLSPPKGTLFFGPPGTGKTLLARAFGNELGKLLNKKVTFYHRKGGDTFSKYFGETSNILKKLFETAIKNKPSILFFDELDGLCPSRDSENHSESYSTVVTTLLGLMDTVPAGQVFVFAATNRLEAVDPAMRRPGRFDKHLEFFPPNLDGRKKIIEINTKVWKVASRPGGPFLEELGAKTLGFTGADLEKLCREVFLCAFNRHVPAGDMSANIDKLEIREEDWKLAMTKIKPSKSAVYGSNVYQPILPDRAIQPLVRGAQGEILKRLMKQFPVEGDSLSSGSMSATPTIFIWEDAVSEESLENLVLPGVFASQELSNVPIYVLSQERLLQPRNPNLQKGIKEIFQQISKTFKPTLLYIPMVDNLMISMRNFVPLIEEQILQLRGKPIAIVASSSTRPDAVEREVMGMFGSKLEIYHVGYPSQGDRVEFFQPFFNEISITLQGWKAAMDNEDRVELQKLPAASSTKTSLKSISQICGLHAAFVATFARMSINSKSQQAVKKLVADLKQTLERQYTS